MAGHDGVSHDRDDDQFLGKPGELVVWWTRRVGWGWTGFVTKMWKPGNTQIIERNHEYREFGRRWARGGEEMSHRSSSTMALDEVKAWVVSWSSTATYCNVVTPLSMWHPHDERRTSPTAFQPVAKQVGKAASAQTHPRSRYFHSPGNMRVESCTNLNGELESSRPITGGEVLHISDIFQSLYHR
jgi:hypothetical protein